MDSTSSISQWQRQQIATPKVLESLSPPSSSCLFAFFWLSLTQQWVVAVFGGWLGERGEGCGEGGNGDGGAVRGVYVIFDFLLQMHWQFAPRVDWTVNRRWTLRYSFANFVHVCIYEGKSAICLIKMPHSAIWPNERWAKRGPQTGTACNINI